MQLENFLASLKNEGIVVPKKSSKILKEILDVLNEHNYQIEKVSTDDYFVIVEFGKDIIKEFAFYFSKGNYDVAFMGSTLKNKIIVETFYDYRKKIYNKENFIGFISNKEDEISFQEHFKK